MKIEFKWALIFVVAMLIWMLLERLVGLHDTNIAHHATYTNLFAIPAVLIFVLALREKRTTLGGHMSYRQGFVAGLIITLIVTALTPISQYITSTFITPDYFANIIDYSVQSGKMSLETAQEHFNLQSYIVQGMIGAPIMGILTTAVVAWFTKRV